MLSEISLNTVQTFMMPFQLSPVATRNSVRKAIPKFRKWAWSLSPSHGWAFEHSTHSSVGFALSKTFTVYCATKYYPTIHTIIQQGQVSTSSKLSFIEKIWAAKLFVETFSRLCTKPFLAKDLPPDLLISWRSWRIFSHSPTLDIINFSFWASVPLSRQ